MKILSIQLHPFGGVKERIFRLHNGLNVIEGPNEFGKSTLSNALWHVLFTPSNLTPGKLRDTMGPWFPRPAGDHARVTLEFESQGQTWTLQKSWGAGAFSSLKSTNDAAIADPDSVQKRLAQLLHRNQATWRHILFLNQAQLNRTIHDLQENASRIDDLQPLLVGANAITGDIAEEKLAAAIDARIDHHFSRWDSATNGPEKGRGIENPWSNKIGTLLGAYYAMETTRRELEQVVAHEKEVDRVNQSIREMEQSLNANREFVVTGRNLRDGLAQREGLEQKSIRLQTEYNDLRKVFVEWPGAEQTIATAAQGIQHAAEAIAELDAELAHARKRASAEELKSANLRLIKAREIWQTTLNQLKASTEIPASTLQELKSIARKINELRIQIAAQKLSATMQAQAPISVTLSRGVNSSESVIMAPGECWEGQAEGKLKFEFDKVCIEVASGTGDVQSLFSQLDQCKIRQQELLAELQLDDLAAVEAADRVRRELVNEEQNTKQLYEAALQGKTETAWAEEIATLEAIPLTRAVAVLDDERNKALTRKAELEVNQGQVLKNVDKWRTEYTDLDTLTTYILDKAAELQKTQTELANLPQLPEGYETVSAYLADLSDKESRQSQLEASLSNLKVEHSALSHAATKHSAEELRDAWESKAREFQRQKENGEALRRVRSKLQQIIEERGNENPMKSLETSIARRFQELTCGAYASVKLDGGAPVEVTGKIPLEAELLSQGTRGSLALATRLSLAELYLEQMQGLLILDDPFTDMDPDRRHAAGRCLGDFAKQRQVIFFTCHPDHKHELEEIAAAKTPEMIG